MKIRHFTFTSYELPFKTPHRTARGVTTSRKGFLVTLKSNKDMLCLGDVALLPAYGTETYDEAAKELERLATQSTFPTWPESLETLDEWSRKMKLLADKTPAVRFGIESALLAGLCQEQDARVEEFLCEDKVEHVHVNALLSGSGEADILASALQASADGYRTFKIKVGMNPVKEDIATLSAVRQHYPEIRLRVDANGAWSLKQALEFFEQAIPLKLEYVEDPLPRDNLADLRTLRKQSKIHMAIDEGARSILDLAKLQSGDLCDVLVLKPTAIGSYLELEDLFFRQGSEGIVISSLMESSVGLSYLAACAAAFGSMQAAHGLGTASYLAKDTLKVSLLPEKGRLTVPDVRFLSEQLK